MEPTITTEKCRCTRDQVIELAKTRAKHNADGRAYVDMNVRGEWFISDRIPLMRTLSCHLVWANGRVEFA